MRKLLAKDPNDRYQTPAELALALEPFDSETGNQPRQPMDTKVQREAMPRWRAKAGKRCWLLWIGIGVAGAGLLACVAGTIYRQLR